jgi:hypothetical protein
MLYLVLGYLVVGYLVVGYLVLGYLVVGYLVLGYLVVGYLVLGYLVVSYSLRRLSLRMQRQDTPLPAAGTCRRPAAYAPTRHHMTSRDCCRRHVPTTCCVCSHATPHDVT